MIGNPAWRHDGKDRSPVDVADVLERVSVVSGLVALLQLQYEHEGHRNEHVNMLLLQKLNSIEQDLSDVVAWFRESDIPF